LLHLFSASHFLVELAQLRDGLQSTTWSFSGSTRGTACFALDWEGSRNGQEVMLATGSSGTQQRTTAPSGHLKVEKAGILDEEG